MCSYSDQQCCVKDVSFYFEIEAPIPRKEPGTIHTSFIDFLSSCRCAVALLFCPPLFPKLYPESSILAIKISDFTWNSCSIHCEFSHLHCHDSSLLSSSQNHCQENPTNVFSHSLQNFSHRIIGLSEMLFLVSSIFDL